MVNGSLEQNNGDEETENGLGAKSSSCELKWNQPFSVAKGIKNSHKKTAYEGLILSILLYGCESWSLPHTHILAFLTSENKGRLPASGMGA